MKSGTRIGTKLLLIVALAIALRVVAALVHPMMQPDSEDYRLLGQQLAAGGPYHVGGGDAVRMPGYPAFLAIVFACAGPSVQVALIVQSIFGGLIVLPVYLLGRRISENVGLLAALLVAIDPLSIAFSAALLTEMPFTLLMLLALLTALRIMEGGRFFWWLVLGILWALGVYMRASWLYLIVPLAILAALYARSGILHRIAGPVLSIFIVLLALAPWQIANIARFHAGYFALTSLEGISLYEAVYPDADGSPKQHLLHPTPEMLNMNEMQRNDQWSHDAWRYIREDPARIAFLGLRKIGRTWNPLFNTAELQQWPVQAISLLWHVPLFGLAIIGMFTRSISFKMKAVLLLPVAYFTMVHAIYLGSVRYRVPLMPLICILAAAGLITLCRPKKEPAFAPTKA